VRVVAPRAAFDAVVAVMSSWVCAALPGPAPD
jgi:hypothetical protein